MTSTEDFMQMLESVQEQRKKAQDRIEVFRLKEYPDDFDTKIPFRINSEIKEAFEVLCKYQGLSTSSAIRLLIEKSIRDWKV